MKIVIAVIIILLVSTPCLADFYGGASMGYIIEFNYFHTDFMIGFAFPIGLRVYTDISTLIDEREGLGFKPMQATFATGARYQLNKNIYFHLRHNCTHPVLSSWHVRNDYLLFSGTELSAGVEF